PRASAPRGAAMMNGMNRDARSLSDTLADRRVSHVDAIPSGGIAIHFIDGTRLTISPEPAGFTVVTPGRTAGELNTSERRLDGPICISSEPLSINYDLQDVEVRWRSGRSFCCAKGYPKVMPHFDSIAGLDIVRTARENRTVCPNEYGRCLCDHKTGIRHPARRNDEPGIDL